MRDWLEQDVCHFLIGYQLIHCLFAYKFAILYGWLGGTVTLSYHTHLLFTSPHYSHSTWICATSFNSCNSFNSFKSIRYIQLLQFHSIRSIHPIYLVQLIQFHCHSHSMIIVFKSLNHLVTIWFIHSLIQVSYSLIHSCTKVIQVILLLTLSHVHAIKLIKLFLSNHFLLMLTVVPVKLKLPTFPLRYSVIPS